jgi:alkaline phosphatase
MFRLKRKVQILLIAILSVAFLATSSLAAKNVIVMVPDGCSTSIQTLARLVKGSPLNVDPLMSGSVKTYMSNSVITGSAAAATAFATGHKTTVRFLGVGPSTYSPYYDEVVGFLTGFTPTAAPFEPLESVLEVAKRNGKATGLIATSRITHATPAAYASHIHDRDMDNEIMEHMVYQDIDVVLGGGKRHLIPTTEGGKRTDGENLIDVLLDRGYQFVETAEQLANAKNKKIWGMFASSHMGPELDRDDLNATQPSIAEMTAKAIKCLKKDDDGFFLMVEGSQVDWAGHSNDTAYMVYDFLAFDEAVGEAIRFAKNDGDTLVLIFPDHNTGALSIGHELSDFPPSYTKTSLEAMIDPIKDAEMTIQGLLYEVPLPATRGGVIATFTALHGPYWADGWVDEEGIDHAQYVADQLNGVGPYYGYYPISKYLSANMTDYGWTTQGHTGEDVPLWSYGPDRPVGTFDNTELAKICADAFDFKLRGSKAWKEYDDSILVYDMTDPENPVNPVAEIGKWSYPVSKDYRVHKKNGTIEYFSDITVHAPESGKVYCPKN